MYVLFPSQGRKTSSEFVPGRQLGYVIYTARQAQFRLSDSDPQPPTPLNLCLKTAKCH
jgi:hypothetical protein